MKHLGQIKSVYPEAYEYEQIRMTRQAGILQNRPQDYELTIRPNLMTGKFIFYYTFYLRVNYFLLFRFVYVRLTNASEISAEASGYYADQDSAADAYQTALLRIVSKSNTSESKACARSVGLAVIAFEKCRGRWCCQAIYWRAFDSEESSFSSQSFRYSSSAT